MQYRTLPLVEVHMPETTLQPAANHYDSESVSFQALPNRFSLAI